MYHYRVVLKALTFISPWDRILWASCSTTWADALEEAFEVDEFPGGMFGHSHSALEQIANTTV